MSIDYNAVLADLEAKKAALETSIASLRAALGLGAVMAQGKTVGSVSYDEHPTELPVGVFLGMSITAAIKLYLKSIKKKQTMREIALALKEGGIESTADDFEKVVTGTLNRLKGGDVLRFKDGWGLAEFYPEHIRNQTNQEKKPKRRKKAKKKAQRKKARDNQEPKEGLEHRIGEVLAKHPEGALIPSDVAVSLGVGARGVALALGRMAKKGKATKVNGGLYSAPPSNVQEMPKAG